MKDSPPRIEKEKDKVEDKKKPTPNKKTFKGLCINCDHRFTCTLPRPESGVWYCEEYE